VGQRHLHSLASGGGAAALVLATGISDCNGNGRVNDDARLWLQGAADDLGASGKDSWYGFGLVNVRGLPGSGVDTNEDGFTNGAETYLGTDPFYACPDDPSDSAWPLDIDDDGGITVTGDVLNFCARIGPAPGEFNWWQRVDLDGDRVISVTGDVLLYRGKAGQMCSSASRWLP
jgi:hypothetical protein